MKKILTVLILNLLVVVPVQAGTIGMIDAWDFDGQIVTYGLIGVPTSYTDISGHFDFDTGTVSLGGPDLLFFGLAYSAEGTIEDQLDGTYLGHLETTWGAYAYNWDILWEITQQGNTANVVTLDGNGDGIPGVTVADGPFVDTSFAIDGTLTAVPVPAAVWLFGSGLIGLFGVARRRNI